MAARYVWRPLVSRSSELCFQSAFGWVGVALANFQNGRQTTTIQLDLG
jgi:hypothetical protein